MSHDERTDSPVKPMLRWAGGKRWLSPTLSPVIKRLLDDTQGRYHEPFLGAGAVFFGLAPQRAILSDLNHDLISTYDTVRTHSEEVARLVGTWIVDKDTYDALRCEEPVDPIRAAARFVFLNRTCYGGIHRTNRQGRFNVPFGGGSRSPAKLLAERGIQRVAEVLNQGVALKCQDFGKALASAKCGDVVYCDPTYTTSEPSQFVRYGAVVFGWEDQVRLHRAAFEARSRGVVVIVSNGASTEIRNLFSADLYVPLMRKKTIGHRGKTQAVHDEALFVYNRTERSREWIASTFTTGTWNELTRKRQAA